MATPTLDAATTLLLQPSDLSIHALRPPPGTVLPTDLLADLEHHRSLFSKLRFSYTEQVTKERLLKAVSADPPALVDGGAAELAALEAKLAGDKGALKAQKTEVEALLRALGTRGRHVASVWRAQEARVADAEVGNVRSDLDRLERRKGELLAMRPGIDAGTGNLMGMGLEETRGLSTERMEEAEAVAARVEEVRREVERRRDEVERMRREVELVEERKREVVEEVMEMRRRREGRGEGSMDEVEAQGRWVRAAEGVLRAVC